MLKHKFQYTFNGLYSLIIYLTSPRGCEWDKKQTPSSLKKYLLEECYEVIDAIDNKEDENLTEELGDLLFHIIFQIKLGEDQKKFKKEQVFEKIINKMIHRHPEVFSSSEEYLHETAESKWEIIKAQEKNTSSFVSLLGDMPNSLPSLSFAQLIQKRAALADFDWSKFDDVLDKVNEELIEIKKSRTSTEKEAEFGDLLFSLVNTARWMGIDSEIALRKANHKFKSRFNFMEELSKKENKDFKSLKKKEKELFWRKSKDDEFKNINLEN